MFRDSELSHDLVLELMNLRELIYVYSYFISLLSSSALLKAGLWCRVFGLHLNLAAFSSDTLGTRTESPFCCVFPSGFLSGENTKHYVTVGTSGVLGSFPPVTHDSIRLVFCVWLCWFCRSMKGRITFSLLSPSHEELLMFRSVCSLLL